MQSERKSVIICLKIFSVEKVNCKNVNTQVTNMNQNHVPRCLIFTLMTQNLLPWLSADCACFSSIILSGSRCIGIQGSLSKPKWLLKPLWETWLVFRGSTGRRSVQGGRQATTRVSAVEAPCFTELTSPSAFCACPSFQPQFMSAICRGRFMLVQVPNKSTLFGPMQTDPASIREKLFTGIDGEYNVRLLRT